MDQRSNDKLASLTRDLLVSFFATYGEGCAQRFCEDKDFQHLLWNEGLRTLGAVAAVMSWWDERLMHQGIAADVITAAMDDSPEVATLRLFTFNNMIPQDALEDTNVAVRIRWFMDSYQQARSEVWGPEKQYERSFQ